MEFEQLLTLFKETHQELQKRAARSVDISLVMRNWLFGWYIVEFEQGGADRADLYGKRLIERLSDNLTARMGRGFSKRSLEQCRRFYECYKEIAQALPARSFHEADDGQKIGQTLPAQSKNAASIIAHILPMVTGMAKMPPLMMKPTMPVSLSPTLSR